MKKEDLDSMMKIIVYLHKITHSPSSEEFERGYARALESCQEYLYGRIGETKPCDTSWKQEFTYESLDIGTGPCDVDKN